MLRNLRIYSFTVLSLAMIDCVWMSGASSATDPQISAANESQATVPGDPDPCAKDKEKTKLYLINPVAKLATSICTATNCAASFVPVDVSSAPSCPKSSDDWAQWRASIAARVPETAFFDQRAKIEAKTLKCLNAYESDPQSSERDAVKSCMAHTAEFLTAISAPYTQTAEENKYTEIPKYLSDDQQFLKLASSYTTANDAVNYLNEKIAKDFANVPASQRPVASRYHSTAIGAFGDESAKDRVVVYYPTQPASNGKPEVPEKWMQFTMRGPDDNPGDTPGDTINVISVYMNSETHLPTSVYADYSRKYDNGNCQISQVPRLSVDCRTCHKGGPHKIFPTTDYGFTKELGAVNGSIHPHANFSKGFHQASWGPPMAPDMGDKAHPATPDTRDTAFFDKCTSGVNGSNIPKMGTPKRGNWYNTVKAGMICSHCHTSTTAPGAMNYPMGIGAGGLLLEHFVAGAKIMPDLQGDDDFDTKLDDNQRNALVACLRYEYYGVLPNGKKDTSRPSQMDEWLMSEPCAAGAAK